MPKGLIVKALSGFYYVQPDGATREETVQCRARGIFKKRGISPLVGDYVAFSTTDNEGGTIDVVKPRKSELIRPPIANVELAVLVFSIAEPKLNCQLLDRLLVHIEHMRIDAVIVLTKYDTIDVMPIYAQTVARKEMQKTINIYTSIGYDVIPTSVRDGYGYEQVKEKLNRDISMFVGQSGVGKSSLLNVMLPGVSLQTNPISHRLGRGKHTTRHVELLTLPWGGYIADTPGFSQLDLLELEVKGLGYGFREFRDYADKCKFRSCTHMHEPSCQVKAAAENGCISHSRYAHYVLFFEEMRKRKRRY